VGQPGNRPFNSELDSERAGPGPAALRTAWFVVLLLFPVALLNYLDRQLLAQMKTSVMLDLPDIEREENWGMILAMFKWVYAGLSPIGGYIADRYSRRWVIVVSLFVWSIVTWLTGQVTTYEQLLWTRALMGISEAFYIPAALALIATHHWGATRSRAVGIHQFGIYSGVILGGFSGYIAEDPDLGWRWAFAACGLVGIIYAVPLAWLLREPQRESPSFDAGHASPLVSMGQLLTNVSFLLLVLYFTLPALPGWVVRDWMPSILKAEFKIGQGQAGVSATLYWQLAAIGGAILGGWLADRWMQTNSRGRIYVSAIGMGLIVPALFGVGYSPLTGQLWVAILFLILFGLGWGFFDCNNMPILCQITQPQVRATGYGLMNLVSISCGGLADWGFGILRDRGVPLFGIFSIFAGAAVLSMFLVLSIRPQQTD
jgi:MFS family permease